MRLSDIIKGRATTNDEARLWTAAHASHFSKSRLRQRGWTGGMVRLILGEPDKTVPNPHDPAGEHASMYLRSRVMAAEATPEFKAARDEKATR